MKNSTNLQFQKKYKKANLIPPMSDTKDSFIWPKCLSKYSTIKKKTK